ncbi:hypothetical protein A8B78_03395 [Jannaschia sp. EhC01]|nr:hypothetical protein A8B78_03395 [Jannaschia sp. EhC01]
MPHHFGTVQPDHGHRCRDEDPGVLGPCNGPERIVELELDQRPEALDENGCRTGIAFENDPAK